jgi:hypothetical protein
MNKILRYSLMAVLAVMGFGNAMAENVIWQEDWSTWADYAKKVLDGVNSNYTFVGTVTNDDGSFKSGTTIYNEALAGGEAPELLIAKNGGSFTATVDLGGKSGDMTLSFKCNKNIPVEVTGGTLGENTGSGNDYVYPITGASGTLTIKFGSVSGNARIDNIKLFQGQGKKPAGLSWGTSSRTVTIGGDDNVFPILSNENNLTVTYSSSEPTVATIASDGTISLVAAGTTVITAESAETAEFEAGKAQYTLTVKEAEGGGGGGEQTVTEVTVAKALEIIAALENGKTTDQVYQVKGFVVGDPDFQRKDDGTLYGNCNFDIADAKGGTDKLTVYRAKNFGNVNFTEETIGVLKADDEVVLQGQLQKYVKSEVVTPEIKNCYLISVNGQTGITNITADQLKNAPAYNVAGQRVNEGYKGLIIKGGKKVVMK